MREALFLVSNGVPFDLAFALDDETRVGFSIALSEINTGRKFNWRTQEFEDPPS